MKKLIGQLFRFGIIGVIAFLIDSALLWFLTEICHIHYLVSSAIAFSISVIVNYILSMKYVFKAKEGLSKRNEFTIFIILSVIGLFINEGIMYLGVDILFYNYMLVKIFSTIIVMIFNFITKKIFIEKNTKKIMS